MSRKELTRRYAVFALALLISAFGISMVACSALGTSPISSLPYVLSLNTPLTMGVYTFIVNMLMVLAQVIMLGPKGVNERRVELLIQIPVSLVFGLFIDLSMNLLVGYHLTVYFYKVAYLILGCAILAVGICLEVIADVTMLSGEFTVQIASRRFNKEFSKVKVLFDCTLVAMATIASLLFVGKINGLREGTIVAALITGPFVKLLSRYTKPITNWFVAARASVPSDSDAEVVAKSNVIITIAREYGSGGHDIGKQIASDLGIAFYDNQLIEMTAKAGNFTEAEVKQREQDINPNLLLRMIVHDYEAPIEKSLSPADALFVTTSKVVREVAANGDCVIVGRCADWILRDMPNCINVYIHASMDYKTQRAIRCYGLSADSARQEVEQINRRRAAHYEHYTGKRWTAISNYHIVCDSSQIPPQDICAMIEKLYTDRKTTSRQSTTSPRQ